jgi:peptidoglycan/xylan/chitin deacetylase (PgdA/CDA1 family)
MQNTKIYLKHRNFFILLTRLLTIVKHYGFSDKKFERVVKFYINLLKKYDIKATFPITADLLMKNDHMINYLLDDHVEFAVHGYNHIDYSQLSHNEQRAHFDMAVRVFKRSFIKFAGFRCPYLRYNDDTLGALSNLPFTWDSSQAIFWDVLGPYKFKKRFHHYFDKVLTQYDVKMAENFVSIPKIEQNLVEIPVSLPDDDLLISRLKIRDPQLLDMILQDMLSLTYIRGELFTLLLHPERIMYYKGSIDHLLEMALSLKPKVWVSSMKQIAEWWQEKRRFKIDIHPLGNYKYQINAKCLDRATLLCKKPNHTNGSFYNGYEVINERSFIVESFRIPLVGVAANSSPQLQDLLINEGIPFERSFERHKYAVFISDEDYGDEKDERKVLRKIDQASWPLLRFWRWPDECRNALALTGDIDAFTIFDFFPRIFHRRPNTIMNRDERKVQKDFFN